MKEQFIEKLEGSDSKFLGGSGLKTTKKKFAGKVH